MTGFIQLILNCLILSANYVILAVGLTLIFGILRTLNFAHGAFYLCGAYIIYVLTQTMGMHYFLAILIAMLGVALIGILMEAGLLYPLTQKSLLSTLGAILGLNMIIERVLSLIFEQDDINIGSYFTGTFSFMGATISIERIMIVVSCLILMILVYLWIQKTRQGVAIRALPDNERVANLEGINTRFIRFLVMGIAACIAAFAGAIVSPTFYINAFIFVEQDARMALRTSHKRILLENGQIITAASSQELLRNPILQESYLS